MAGIDSTSKTQKALAWLDADQERSVLQAAKKFDIQFSALYRAINQRNATINQRCPCCGNLIRSPKKEPAKKGKR